MGTGWELSLQHQLLGPLSGPLPSTRTWLQESWHLPSQCITHGHRVLSSEAAVPRVVFVPPHGPLCLQVESCQTPSDHGTQPAKLGPT
jgi:hypothetical protein